MESSLSDCTNTGSLTQSKLLACTLPLAEMRAETRKVFWLNNLALGIMESLALSDTRNGNCDS